MSRIREAWAASLHRRIATAAWSASPAMTLAWAGAVAASIVSSVGFVLVISRLVGDLPIAVARGSDSAASDRVWTSLVVAAGLLIAQPLSAGFQIVLGRVLGRKIEGAARAQVMRAALAPPGVLHLHDPKVVADIEAATTLGTARFGPSVAMDGWGMVVTSLLSGLAMAAIVGWFWWWLGLALAIGWLQARRNRWKDNLDQWTAMLGGSRWARRHAYFRQLSATPPAAKELRVFGLGQWLVDLFDGHWHRMMGTEWEGRRARRPSLWGTLLLLVVANVVAVTWAVRAARHVDIGIGELALVLQAILGARVLSDPGTTNIFDISFTLGTRTLQGADDLLRRFGARAVPAATTHATVAPDGTHEIRFEGVSFTYPQGTGQVLDGLNLTIPAGASLAIVGENGAGKTTLIRLLAGLMEPRAGRVTVDGVDLAAIEAERWRSRVSIVFQDFARLPLTLRENIALGAAGVTLTDDQYAQIVERSDLAAIRARLSDGLDTPLSAQMRGGSDLSGGEWQRVVLGRALAGIEAGATVLVMDEPTANLDVRAEAAFYDRFLDITEGLTTIVISHRFATVRRADAIAVLSEGRIIELGSHDELMAIDGTYARLFRLQADAFDDTGDSVGV